MVSAVCSARVYDAYSNQCRLDETDITLAPSTDDAGLGNGVIGKTEGAENDAVVGNGVIDSTGGVETFGPLADPAREAARKAGGYLRETWVQASLAAVAGGSIFAAGRMGISALSDVAYTLVKGVIGSKVVVWGAPTVGALAAGVAAINCKTYYEHGRIANECFSSRDADRD